MTRPLRLDYDGAMHHCMARGNERRVIFRDDDDRNRFLGLLADATRRFGLIVHAYVLMPNHFHLLLESMRGMLSQGMKHLSGQYAQYFNSRHDRVGHLVQGRFKSILVQRESYLLALSRYLHQNPVRAGMVAVPWDYRWSSCRDYLFLREAPEWLEMRETLSYFNGDPEEYRRFLVAEQEPNPFLAVRAQALLGHEEFELKVRGRLAEAIETASEAPYLDAIRNPSVQERVLRALVDCGGCWKDLRGEKRAWAIYLLRAAGGMGPKEISRLFEVGASAVGMQLLRLRKRMKEDEELQRRMTQLEASVRKK